MLDSSCPIHIFSKKEYFDAFQEKKTSFVSLGDRFTYDVIGVGTMKIKMFDGVIHTLGGVTYVPKMRINLISLG